MPFKGTPTLLDKEKAFRINTKSPNKPEILVLLVLFFLADKDQSK